MGQNYRREGKGWDQNENQKDKASSVILPKRKQPRVEEKGSWLSELQAMGLSSSLSLGVPL